MRINNDYNSSLNGEQQNNSENHFSLEINYKLLLKQFENDPLYNQCYEGILIALSKLSLKTGDSHIISSLGAIYSATKTAVDDVLLSDTPEIDIIKHMTSFLHNHKANWHKCKKDISFNFGYIQGMVFLIVLYDSMQQKNACVIRQLSQWRHNLESEASQFDILDGNPMWKLIAERIPQNNEPRLEDIKLENERLLKTIEDLKENLKQKDEEINKLNQGMIKEDNEFKTWSTGKRINILHSLLNLPNHIEGEKRKEFKKLCKFMTKAEDTTLDKLLSQNQLQKMIEKREMIQKEFLILTRK